MCGEALVMAMDESHVNEVTRLEKENADLFAKLQQYKKQNAELQVRNTELVLRNQRLGKALSKMHSVSSRVLSSIAGAKSEVANAEEHITTLLDGLKMAGN